MKVIEPHIHMIARTTQDYERMVRMHTVACCEPAFWAGYDRTSSQAFFDYFTHISEFEPTRAAQYQIEHYCWICINPKEADDLVLAREVISFIPEFLHKPTVLGIGEIGLNLNTVNEMTIFQEQVELALKYEQLIWIHTPHLKDKLKGTRMMLDYLKGHGKVNPEKVCFDHCEEHTLKMIVDAGFWAAMTIYPVTKNSPPRVVDALETYGIDHMLVDASGDWGPSDPGTLHDAIFEMKKRGHKEEHMETVFYNNPCYFLGQCKKFRPSPSLPKEKAWAV
ncbi:MAG: TatD family hydrolase [Desulfobacteraceae bacterium]|uniref:TatD family hydrolase n=1 Tax=Candidatus Desulfacyla euxinica TaxID=2841693 RepID=A0A8J6T8Z4_9DELT|nr:TatD family hydrolase [Candidatus Desulfacyla euxinica]MBL6979235.1 TatD family hydrolase [Desulfobacteraceae bacterium]